MEYIPFFNLTLIGGQSLNLALTHLLTESTFVCANGNGEKFRIGKIRIIIIDTHQRHEGLVLRRIENG